MTHDPALRAEVLRELAGVGVEVDDLHDLRSSGVRYPPEVTSLLVGWLERTTQDPSLQEAVVRTLSVPWARTEALSPMLELFRTAPGGTPAGEARRWAVGNALDVLATDAVFDEMSALATDETYGRSRQMVVLWFGRAKKHRERAVDLLLGLLEQEDVSGHAVKALAKLKDPRSVPGLSTMTDDSRPWVRNAAKRAVERIDA